MICSVEIANVASFEGEPERLDNLTKINFIFGSNGTGKTTVSRVIADPQWAESCSVQWEVGSRPECLVYNRDFKERNFEQSSALKGIFTLGEERIETRQKIQGLLTEIETLKENVITWTKTLEGEDGFAGKRSELEDLKKEFEDQCWVQKQKYDDRFREAFAGWRNSRAKFAAKILEEEDGNKAKLHPLEDLEKRAEIIFGPVPSRESPISLPDYEGIVSHESNPILDKVVVGASEVGIADMIEKLGNSDWVRSGWKYFEQNDGTCPFCQEKAPPGFAEQLQRYFDATFEEATEEIAELERLYRRDAQSFVTATARLADEASGFLNSERINSLLDLLRSKLDKNISKIETKRREPSRKITLEPVGDVANKITSLVDNANRSIEEHNQTVENLADERKRLTAQVWRYLLDEELNADLKNYHDRRSNVKKAINSLEGKIGEAKAEQQQKSLQIQKLEKEVTSVQPTADAINQTLQSFGFQNFKLTTAEDPPSYKLVRLDGSEAKETLSEGERSFVTFLYFYHRLRGSDSDSGSLRDRVIVFDDPVSSLDSDILFVVSTLIKSLCDEVAKGESHLKQVFVMTHNVYFHRQVTYGHNKREGPDNTFWVIRKNATGSQITKYEANPVRSSYELLWSELRDGNRSNFAVQNAMRRILEHYFKILGGMTFRDIAQEFEGDDRRIYNSLISWMHAGSHHAIDDLYVYIEDATIDAYLRVFKEIFRKCDQLAHYEMMMNRVPSRK